MRLKITSYIITLGALLSMGFPALPASAAGASISLTANRGTVAAGGSLIVAVYMNGGGTAVNAIQADVSFPSSKLQYVGYSSSGSAFEIGASSGGGDGLASVARGTTSPVAGSALVGTLTFKALAGSGSAAISVAGSSSLVSATDNTAVPYSPGSVSVNFGAAAASSSSPAAPAAPAPPKDITPPLISAIKVKDLTPFSATITWTTNEASDSAVDYGVDANYGLAASASPAVTAHAVVLNSAFLTPQTLLHYRVKSTDGSGNVATGTDQSFELPGVPVTVVVRGADGKPQPGASVTLDGASGTTNSKGLVTLPSSLGNKKVVTTYGGVTIQKPITVSKTTKPLPPIQLDLSRKPLNPWLLTSIGLTVVVLTLLAIDGVLFGSRLLARLTGIHLIPSWLHPRLGHMATASVATIPAVPILQHTPPPLKDPPLPTEPTDVVTTEPAPDAIDDMLKIPRPEPELAASTSPPSPDSPKALILDKPIEITLAPTPEPTVKQITISDAPSLPPAPSQAIASRLKKKPKTHAHKTKTAPKLPKT